MKQPLEATETGLDLKEDLSLREAINNLAEQFYGKNSQKCAYVADWLWDTYTRAKGKDVLLIHNPGGWGCTLFEECLEWERSVVEGVCATIEWLG